jgi:hypothetical protein
MIKPSLSVPAPEIPTESMKESAGEARARRVTASE